MKFSEFEDIMNAKGINTLADIARSLDATPQAVSNWKARDQIPYHVVAGLKSPSALSKISSNDKNIDSIYVPIDKDKTTLSNIILT